MLEDDHLDDPFLVVLLRDLEAVVVVVGPASCPLLPRLLLSSGMEGLLVFLSASFGEALQKPLLLPELLRFFKKL